MENKARNARILVVIKEPGKPAFVEPSMRNDLEALAQIVGRVPVFYRIATDLVIASNPAARRDGLPYCCRVANLDLYGTVVALNMNGDHYLPLKAAVVPLAMRLLGGTQNERSKN